ncbi:MAG TPA: TolC family outer membrane protein [Methylophilaceae bacterium]|nr:TolC family outer membrane protein [Methylophilaceae bacterium]
MNKILCIIAASLLPVLAQADAGTQNLLVIYRQALASDPVLASAEKSNVAAQEKQVQGKALLLPVLTMDAAAKHSDTDIHYREGVDQIGVRSAGDHGFETYQYGVNVTQPLFRKQNAIQYEQSKTQVTQADMQLSLARQDLIVNVTQAYFDVVLAQDKINLLEAQKAAISQQLEQAKANFEVGTATITDVNEAQARYDLTIAQEIAAQNDLETKKRFVEFRTGQQPSRLATAREDLRAVIPEPRDMEQWVALAQQNNLPLKIQQQALQLATQQIEYARAGHLPTLDVVGRYSDTGATGNVNGVGTDLRDATVGLQFQIPLYQGGAITSRQREAVANKDKALDDVEAARREADLRTRQSYLNVASAVAQVSAYEQALASSKSQLDSTNLGYEVGVRTSVDVLNAQQQYYQAKYNLLEVRYAWLVSIIKLKSYAGVLTEDDLAETNRYLEGS